MKNTIFLFILLGTGFFQNLAAQCNPAEYQRIMAEADAFKENGHFITAKDNYAAAKAFACSASEANAVEAQIDKLSLLTAHLIKGAELSNLQIPTANRGYGW